MNKEKIFIGVAWPYANAPLHLGHISGTYLACDYFARFKRLTGADVLMVSGSDSHGTPITVKAQEEGITPEELVNRVHPIDVDLFNQLGVTFDLYTHTRTKNHREVVQDEFLKLLNNGYLFEKEVEQFYCAKCEKFLPDRYVEGECPLCHYENARGDQCDECCKLLNPEDLVNPRCKTCGEAPEIRKTTHLFFNLKKVEPKLKEWIGKQTHWRKQVQVFTENWIKDGLQARSFTRDLKDGIPVPWEKMPDGFNKEKYKDKVIYVWFEAVTGYLSAAIEWEKINVNPELVEKQEGTDGQKVIVKKSGEYNKWEDFWKDPECKHYYFIGKDNIPFHSIIWPALLIAREDGLNLPYDIPASQFLTLEGKQFSKSRNWYITVDHIVQNYGVDAVRYFFAASYPEGKDIDFKWAQFFDRINNELVANLGNFIYRVLTFTHKNFEGQVPSGEIDQNVQGRIDQAFHEVGENLEATKFAPAMSSILELSRFGNQYLNENAPWTLIKTDKDGAGNILFNCFQIINALKVLFYPCMPHAAEKLHKSLNLEGTVEAGTWEFSPIPSGHKFNEPEILFQKIPEEKLDEEIALLGKDTDSVGNKNFCSQYDNIVVGEIVGLEKHPTKEHLTVATVSVGNRHACSELQIVCGATNLEVGQKVPVALEGAIVPATKGTDNEIKIKNTKFAGVESQGMLCSGKELGINENDEKIYVLGDEAEVGEALQESISN